MPIVTLTSDLGSQQQIVASIKGKLLSSFADLHIIDIEHYATPFNLQKTVYHFKQTYRNFPNGTFHFLFNDLYSDSKQQLLYVYENNQHIFCADNGFLTMLFEDQAFEIMKLDEKVFPYNILTVADSFITQAALIQQGNQYGLIKISVDDIVIRKSNKAIAKNNTLEAQVLLIDTFGNVVLNVTQAEFEEERKQRNFKILFMRDEEITNMSQHYNDVSMGEKLCLFNSANYLEIAINKGNAAQLFGFHEGNDRSLFYNNIKIFFE